MVTKRIIKKKLDDYISRLQKDVAVDQVYLVGSWAKGKAAKDSDIDVLVVAKAFESMNMDKILTILYKNSGGMGLELDLLPATNNELKNASKLTTLGAIREDKKILLFDRKEAKFDIL